jgi:hypothetical protein
VNFLREPNLFSGIFRLGGVVCTDNAGTQISGKIFTFVLKKPKYVPGLAQITLVK